MKEKEKPSYSIAVQQNQFKMVRYPDYEAAYGQIATAARYHKMCRIIGHPGSGKTSLLLDYQQNNANTYYICPPKGCPQKDLLRLLCTPIDFYPGNETMCGLSQLLITHLNSRPMDTTFLIDEADNLCGSNSSIRKLDLVRYVWDFTRTKVSFIFAAPHDLEALLKKGKENISNSQFYRRCSVHVMSGMPLDSIKEFLENIESEFHVRFEHAARIYLTKRISDSERGGIGIVAEIIEKCLMILLPPWGDYIDAITLNDFSREEALLFFEELPEQTITMALVKDACSMHK
jgi:hypothetical protein